MNSTSSLVVLIGIDWADDHHDVALQAVGSSKVERLRIAHGAEAITEWISSLRRRFPEGNLAIALETSRGPLVHALLDYDFVILYPVNPRSLKRFRETFTPSGAKDDLPDADLLRELLLKHRDRLRPWMPEDVQTRTLRRMAEARRKFVDQRTQFTQQLRALLKEYFPQALDWVGDDLTAPLARDFLLKWPSLEAVQRARPHTIRKFYYAHNCRSAELIEQRIASMQHATPLTRDRAVIDTAILQVELLVSQLKAMAPGIERLERQIQKVFSSHADAPLFESLPGSGPALAPRLLAIFGSDRDRFASAAEVQEFTGIAPVTERSGKRTYVHWRWSASTFIRQSIHEFAHHSIRFSAWADAYYQLQRERGKGHHAAVRALAFKWLRVIWRCWIDGTLYNEQLYIRSLIARGSPVARRIAAAA